MPMPLAMRRNRTNRVTPNRHDDSMVNIQQARTARHLQADQLFFRTLLTEVRS